ncbi:MAG TPA: VOC family protein [Gammaproteobacteria bacterium]|nr:VOC family protein [Gammaproteobacteria bacterium]
MNPRSRVLRLLRISRTVSDLNKTLAFYTGALGFSISREVRVDEPAWGTLMAIPGAHGHSSLLRLGEQELELLTFNPPGRPYPPASKTTDFRFQHIAVVVSDMDKAYARLCQFPFMAITEHGPQRLPSNTGSVIAFKFRDPDGHPVELIHFPAGTGDTAWQSRDEVFLGIDHSAIDVANLEASIDFYTRLLGLSVESRSVNTGPEQVRLDHAPDVLVEVVALQPAMQGLPHLELLGYAQPASGFLPVDPKSNDIVADRTVLQVNDLPRLMKALDAESVKFISPQIATMRNGDRAVLVRDPTGHILMLMELHSV